MTPFSNPNFDHCKCHSAYTIGCNDCFLAWLDNHEVALQNLATEKVEEARSIHVNALLGKEQE